MTHFFIKFLFVPFQRGGDQYVFEGAVSSTRFCVFSLKKSTFSGKVFAMVQKRVRNHVNPLSILIEHSFDGFGNDHPILVDVGACKGEFSAELIEKFPDHNFILFEIRRPLAQKLAEKFADKKNVAVFDGDAARNRAARAGRATCLWSARRVARLS